MPDKTILIANLKAGDILLFHGFNGVSFAQGAAQFLKMATVVPALVSASQTGLTGLTGNVKASHAGLVTTGGVNAEFAHARKSGIAESSVTTSTCRFLAVEPYREQIDFPWVYRPTKGGLGRDAAEVASLWSKPGVSGKMSYTVSGAIGSAFHSSSFGSGAKQRAQAYRQARMTRGGPQGTLAAQSATFCSAFVIACVQACLSETLSASNMSLDAIHTSPATLQNYLGNSGAWRYEGRLIV
jgi:hypothetical protein